MLLILTLILVLIIIELFFKNEKKENFNISCEIAKAQEKAAENAIISDKEASDIASSSSALAKAAANTALAIATVSRVASNKVISEKNPNAPIVSSDAIAKAAASAATAAATISKLAATKASVDKENAEKKKAIAADTQAKSVEAKQLADKLENDLITYNMESKGMFASEKSNEYICDDANCRGRNVTGNNGDFNNFCIFNNEEDAKAYCSSDPTCKGYINNNNFFQLTRNPVINPDTPNAVYYKKIVRNKAAVAAEEKAIADAKAAEIQKAESTFIYGPTLKVWNDGDCSNLLNKQFSNLIDCKIECSKTTGCTAFNYNSTERSCNLRNCTNKNEPSWFLSPFDGYSNYPTELDKLTQNKVIVYVKDNIENEVKKGDFNKINHDDFKLKNNLSYWELTIVFNSNDYSGGWQSIIGNMYNNSVSRGWGLWVNPGNVLHWSESSKTWNLDGLGALVNGTTYKLIITFFKDIYSFDLINLNNNLQKREKIQKASPLTTNVGFVTIGGRWANHTELFKGNIKSIKFVMDKFTVEKAAAEAAEIAAATALAKTMAPENLLKDILAMKPMGWYDGSSYNLIRNKWNNKVDNTSLIPVNITKTDSPFPFIHGKTTSTLKEIPWPGLNKDYTFIHLAKYNNNSANRRRIWSGIGGNWLSGFWENRVAYFHEGWFNENGVPIDIKGSGQDWLLSVDMNSFVRANKGEYEKIGNSYSPQGITINAGQYLEPSDFAIAEFIIFNRNLTKVEYIKIEEYFSRKYGLFGVNREIEFQNIAEKEAELRNQCQLMSNGIPDFNCKFGNMTTGTNFELNGWKLVSSIGTYGNEGLPAILTNIPPPLNNTLDNYPRFAGFLNNSVIIGIIGPTEKRLKGVDWYGIANYGSARNAKNVKLYGSNNDFSSNLSDARSATLIADFTIPQENITTQKPHRINLDNLVSFKPFKAFYFDIINNYGDSSVKVGSIYLDFV
jgi:hypothetical protein